MAKTKRYTGEGVLTGFISGSIIDIVQAILRPVTPCSPDLVVGRVFCESLGVARNLWFIGIILAILGGFIGHYIKKGS